MPSTLILRGMIRRARPLCSDADQDALTGLRNRHELELHVERSRESAEELDGHHSLPYLDLSGQKQISDNRGQTVLDEMLRPVADGLARLEHCKGEKGVEIAGNLVEAIQHFRFGWKGKSYSIEYIEYVESNFGVVESNAVDAT